MISTEYLEAVKKIIEEALMASNIPFYKSSAFYISNFIGIVSIVFSIKSFIEAKKAKEAANKAAQSVKRQSMVIEVLEISRICVLEPNMNYVEASNNFNQVTSRVKYVSGFYNDDSSQDLRKILTDIESSLEKIRTTLNDNNPFLMPQQTNIPNQIYYSIEPLFSTVVGNLGVLKGILEKKLINN